MRRELRVETRPVGVASQLHCLLLPVRHVGRQCRRSNLRVFPALGRQHFEALGQQHSRFALHLGAVLQVIDALDALGQPGLEAGQRFTRQRRAGLGGVALPGHRIGDVELGLGQ